MRDSDWQTRYYGRFKLDLPKNSEDSAYFKIYNEKIDLISKNGKKDINTKTAELIEQLKQGKARGTYSRYEKTITLENESVLIISKLEKLYTFNCFFLTNKNTLYRMTVSALNEADYEGAIEKMKLINNAIKFRSPQDAPPAGAFAIEAGYLKFSPQQPAESVYMGSQIAGHPGTYVSLLTQRVSQLEEPLFARFDKQHTSGISGQISELISNSKTLRKQNRMIGALPAQEIAIMTEVDGKQFYNFQLEYQGTVKSNTLPYLALELGTHEVGSDFKSSEEALAFWDRVVNSLEPAP
ncbi:T6SS immunity protein Tli4 family protein [Pseudomonas sp. NPDC089422]|uniref:T6SS immunity protein Tli4 family protein n=1 Tax=Pseudomonas sp. NPDC089422 TaxID=3364466 RepID=UPI0037FDA8BF